MSTFTTAVPSTSAEPEFLTVQIDRLAAGLRFGSAGGNMYKWSLGCAEGSKTCDVTSMEFLEGVLNGVVKDE